LVVSSSATMFVSRSTFSMAQNLEAR
jgi:hypothetical protein